MAGLRFTGRQEGDLRPGAAGVERRWRAVVDRPGRYVHQVHGPTVSVVTERAGGRGEDADALVTADAGVALAVFTADCAPVLLTSAEGPVGAVHAGWRGLQAGVVEAAVDALRRLGADRIRAALGPCIHPECYEFSPADLDAVAGRLGDGVRSRTAAGRPALDVPAAVAAALSRSGVELVDDTGACTSCSPAYFSHRSRADTGRQAGVVWR